MLFFYITV